MKRIFIFLVCLCFLIPIYSFDSSDKNFVNPIGKVIEYLVVYDTQIKIGYIIPEQKVYYNSDPTTITTYKICSFLELEDFIKQQKQLGSLNFRVYQLKRIEYNGGEK